MQVYGSVRRASRIVFRFHKPTRNGNINVAHGRFGGP